MNIPKRPSLRADKSFAARHCTELCAGVDEAGRGPLAGPVVAAAVMFDWKKRPPAGINDSKKLSESQRLRLFREIKSKALAYGVGLAIPQEIDHLNILQATHLAVLRALDKMTIKPEVLITDYLLPPNIQLPVYPLIKGDSISSSVAAASVLAKVTRDQLMEEYHQEFPHYDFAVHKGYPTERHLERLQEHGPCSVHRLSFNGVSFFSQEIIRSRSFMKIAPEISNVEDIDPVLKCFEKKYLYNEKDLLLEKFKETKGKRYEISN